MNKVVIALNLLGEKQGAYNSWPPEEAAPALVSCFPVVTYIAMGGWHELQLFLQFGHMRWQRPCEAARA